MTHDGIFAEQWDQLLKTYKVSALHVRALPFGDVPLHPTCADCCVCDGVSGCQLRTMPRYTLLGRTCAFCRITGYPEIIPR
jgi:hypothetical protein